MYHHLTLQRKYKINNFVQIILLITYVLTTQQWISDFLSDHFSTPEPNVHFKTACHNLSHISNPLLSVNTSLNPELPAPCWLSSWSCLVQDRMAGLSKESPTLWESFWYSLWLIGGYRWQPEINKTKSTFIHLIIKAESVYTCWLINMIATSALNVIFLKNASTSANSVSEKCQRDTPW